MWDLKYTISYKYDENWTFLIQVVNISELYVVILRFVYRPPIFYTTETGSVYATALLYEPAAW